MNIRIRSVEKVLTDKGRRTFLTFEWPSGVEAPIAGDPFRLNEDVPTDPQGLLTGVPTAVLLAEVGRRCRP